MAERGDLGKWGMSLQQAAVQNDTKQHNDGSTIWSIFKAGAMATARKKIGSLKSAFKV